MEKNVLDLDRTMPNVELAELFPFLQYVQVSSGFSHYFLSYHEHRQTDTHTSRHTDRDEYSIVVVDKWQL